MCTLSQWLAWIGSAQERWASVSVWVAWNLNILAIRELVKVEEFCSRSKSRLIYYIMLRSQRHVTSNWRFSSRRWGDGERASPGPQDLFSGLFQTIRSGNISRSGQKVKKLDKVKVVTITISRATFSENEGQTMPGGNHGRSGVQGKRDYFKGRPPSKDLPLPCFCNH